MLPALFVKFVCMGKRENKGKLNTSPLTDSFIVRSPANSGDLETNETIEINNIEYRVIAGRGPNNERRSSTPKKINQLSQANYDADMEEGCSFCIH